MVGGLQAARGGHGASRASGRAAPVCPQNTATPTRHLANPLPSTCVLVGSTGLRVNSHRPTSLVWRLRTRSEDEPAAHAPFERRSGLPPVTIAQSAAVRRGVSWEHHGQDGAAAMQ